MSQGQKHINPMKFAGSSRAQRILKALLPSAAPIDQRGFADLIVFARNYASFLNYFKTSDAPNGDWKQFMEMDLSVTLAVFSKLNIQKYSAFIKDIENKISASNKEKDLKKYFKSLFDFNFSMTKMLNDYFELLPEETDFKLFFRTSVRSVLPEYYKRLASFYQQAIADELIVSTEDYLPDNRPEGFILSQDFPEDDLNKELWIQEEQIIEGEYVLTFEDELDLGDGSIKERIKNAVTHNLFSTIASNYLKVLTLLINRAATSLEKSLENFPKHTPHYALYLTFLKLFKISQDHLNDYTERHLHLYYDEILQLHKKQTQPDAAFLTVELSKAASDAYLLKNGILFKAGKDKDGEDLFYRLKEDTSVGKAEIEELKNVFVSGDGANKSVFISEKAASMDGEGAPSTFSDKSWLPFGDKKRSKAKIGFAIASRNLLLKGGKRRLTFKLYLNQPISLTGQDLEKIFAIKLTAGDGWLESKSYSVSKILGGARQVLSFTVDLSLTDAPIVAYDPTLHAEYYFETKQPVAFFMLKNAAAPNELWSAKFEKIDIDIDVKELKDLKLSNDIGRIDVAKPFEPFGSIPKVNGSLFIGCNEFFEKAYALPENRMAQAHLNIEWDNYDEMIKLLHRPNRVEEYLEDDEENLKSIHEKNSVNSNGLAVNKNSSNKYEIILERTKPESEYKVSTSVLNDGNWGNVSGNQDLFSFSKYGEEKVERGKRFGSRRSEMLRPGRKVDASSTQKKYVVFFSFEDNSAIDLPVKGLGKSMQKLDDSFYGIYSNNGFFKINLLNDFGHSTYLDDWQSASHNPTYKIPVPKSDYTYEQMIKMFNENEFQVEMPKLPETPYVPRIKNISLDYNLTVGLDLSEQVDASGEGEFIVVYPFSFHSFDEVPSTSLLPILNNEGSLFIGLKNLQKNQVLSLLFTLAEGTANPERDDQPVNWHYLSKLQKWAKFEKEELSDGTRGMIKTGIIKFSIAEDIFISEDENSMGWLMLSVKEKTDAICRIIDIHPNAIQVHFDDYRNKGNYFKEVLPKGTIAKPLNADKYIKKVEQPFDSFNGIPAEKDEQYFTRISERLRHKDRAVAMWDYERIILESFPDIYQVKCLAHTQLNEHFYSEMKPGHVLLIPVPDLKGKEVYNPFEPVVSKSKLNDIKEYLQKKSSPHIQIAVSNPVFEKVQLDFKVRYRSDDFALLTKRLRTDLEAFLAPWAFGNQAQLDFGTRIHKSILINFIEELPYVDMLTDLKMFHIVPGEGYKRKDADQIEASTGRSVLISVASELDNDNGGHKIIEWNI